MRKFEVEIVYDIFREIEAETQEEAENKLFEIAKEDFALYEETPMLEGNLTFYSNEVEEDEKI